ncbi:LysR family transcriptional regulator [Oceanisphaera sp.]|uniref:LysR family transcriptional regulator n=1 Tax=Oceanisphaera sp. TaxID=1929979 RepID=UPI003A956646
MKLSMGDFCWDDLKYFLALHRCKRVSHAAKILDTSRATISNRIQALESNLNVKLFVQSIDGFDLTSAGLVLLNIAEEVEMKLSSNILSEALIMLDVPEIKIGVNEGISDYFVAHEMSSYAKKNPINVKLITLSKNTNVSTKEVDISIAIQKPKSDAVVTRVLTEYSLGIYASEGLSSTLPEKMTKHNIKDIPWVGYIEEMVYSEALLYHRELPEDINFSFQSTSLAAQVHATKAGVGLCILPYYIGSTAPGLVRVMPQITFTRYYWISTRADVIGSRKLSEVWNFIINRFKDKRDCFIEKV